MKICRSFDSLFSEYSKKLEGEKRYNGKLQVQYKYVLGLGHPLSDRTIRDRAKLQVLKLWEILMPTNNFFKPKSIKRLGPLSPKYIPSTLEKMVAI